MRIGIIGAGIFGLASALELRHRGHELTIYEQGTVANERAASMRPASKCSCANQV